MTALYDLLGVVSSASAAEIRAAYRLQAKRAHPDAGGDEKLFHDLNQAKTVLLDADRRARYDATGEVDDAPDNSGSFVVQRVMQTIERCASDLMARGVDPETVDILEYARAALKTEVRKHEDALRRMREAADRTDGFAARFAGKDGQPDRIGVAFKGQSDALRRKLDSGNEAAAELAAALAMLDGHTFEVKAPADGRQPHFVFKHVT